MVDHADSRVSAAVFLAVPITLIVLSALIVGTRLYANLQRVKKLLFEDCAVRKPFPSDLSNDVAVDIVAFAVIVVGLTFGMALLISKGKDLDTPSGLFYLRVADRS
jgi:hypothetical protein